MVMANNKENWNGYNVTDLRNKENTRIPGKEENCENCGFPKWRHPVKDCSKIVGMKRIDFDCKKFRPKTSNHLWAQNIPTRTQINWDEGTSNHSPQHSQCRTEELQSVSELDGERSEEPTSPEGTSIEELKFNFWVNNFHNARRFFNSKGNIKTKSRLKDKWYYGFFKDLEELLK